MTIREFTRKDELDAQIVYVIHQHNGEENAIDRWKLVEAVFGAGCLAVELGGTTDSNKFDRKLRNGIERLRNNGHIICNMGTGDGYYVAATQDEYLKFRAMYGAHAFPIMATIHKLDEAAAEKWSNVLQPTLF
jgi:hypothetical protein